MIVKVKKILRFILIFVLGLLIAVSPPMQGVWSMAVMGVYSAANEHSSVLRDNDVKIDIPGGLVTREDDWYPFVMTFNADTSFSNYINADGTRLTIMYNFPAFSMLDGCSRLYDEDSPLYSSFYGAYAVKMADDTPYGFSGTKDGLKLDERAAAVVPEYDYHRLVLRDFGLTNDNSVFEWEILEKREGITYAGYTDWEVIDAELVVNGCAHTSHEFVQSYLQYGRCAYDTDDSLAPLKMYGRIYARYFEQKNMSIFFYIITAKKEQLESCDRDILSKSTIEIGHN